MEGRDGHVWLGMVFCIIGLWHLYNHVKKHVTCNKNFKSLLWFPTSIARHLELYLILISCSIFTFMELRQRLFDHDGAIRASKLHHIEHACIATAFSLHALFAILLDKARPYPKVHIDVGHFLTSLAFAQELLLFHFHSTDHVGLEGQYHWLLQEVVLVCLITTLLSVWMPRSFMICFIRSLAVILQGLWLIAMGFMLFTPDLAPKGCSFHKDHYGRDVIKCDSQFLNRGKALVNILFSLFLIGMMAFGVCAYWFVNKFYDGIELLENEEGKSRLEDTQGFLPGRTYVPFDIEA